jgi:hypothetical protein
MIAVIILVVLISILCWSWYKLNVIAHVKKEQDESLTIDELIN